VRSRRACSLILLISALVAVYGCGGEVIDHGRAEHAISNELERSLHIGVANVSCPDDIKVDPSSRFHCTADKGGSRDLDVVLKIVNSKADVQMIAVEGR
jgi:Domain of unknown function (DUF4333)